MIDFLSGAVTLGYAIAGVCFLRFWKKTRDRLFVQFAWAFWLFAANQLLISVPKPQDERSTWAYVLRVLGFVLIVVAIVGKNAPGTRRSGDAGRR